MNISSCGVVPVAIYGSRTLDVTTIDPGSISLAGARVKMVGKANKLLSHLTDLNADGFYRSSLPTVETVQWLMQPGATTARLDATTYAGIPVFSQDSIEVLDK